MLSLFTIPKPFHGRIDVIQRNAIRSWTLLRPACEIILFGDEEGTGEAAAEFGVRHEPEVACNEYGTPLLNDLFARSEDLATYGLLFYVNADIILIDDFMRAVERVASTKRRFLMVGRRWNVDLKEPWDFSAPDWEAKLSVHTGEHGELFTEWGIDYFVFPRGLFGTIPPLAIGRAYYDNWLICEARRRFAAVVDATPVVTAVHQNHNYDHFGDDTEVVMRGLEAQRNGELAADCLFNLKDVTHVLQPDGLQFAWWSIKAELTRRLLAVFNQFLNLSRPIRSSLGLTVSSWKGRGSHYGRRQSRAPVLGFREALGGSIKGTALVCYITEPFYIKDVGTVVSHQNQWEAVEIARILNELGFIVDVVDYRDEEFQPARRYDLLFGIGFNFERYASMLHTPVLKIYYATEAHWSFHNRAEHERLTWLERRRGVKLQPRRTGRMDRSAELADVILCLGNEFTRSTYLPYNPNVLSIDISSFDFLGWPDGKDFELAKRCFLWFGGWGMVHKGLDLVLEVFKELTHLELYIGGNVGRDSEFVKVYRRELFESSNIKLLDWLDIRSQVFEDITRRCGYVLYPSCSEGEAGSVITCMHRGLVPIMTRETGVDTNDFGVILDDAQIETVRDAVLHAAERSAMDLERCSKKAFDEAKRRYTREAFSRNLRTILRGFVDKHLIK